VGYVSSRRPIAIVVRAAKPDVLILDDPLGEPATLERLRELRECASHACIVLLTGRMEPEWLGRASAEGAQAAVARTVHPVTLGTMIREIAAGTIYHTFTQPRRPSAEHDHGLTARELQILQLMASGASNGGIAAQLWVTEQTVKFHLSNIYRKLGVANRTQASRFAHLRGLVEEDAPLAPVGAVTRAA
jgi:DNA-binding NarL/FixJ family response regulator